MTSSEFWYQTLSGFTGDVICALVILIIGLIWKFFADKLHVSLEQYGCAPWNQIQVKLRKSNDPIQINSVRLEINGRRVLNFSDGRTTRMLGKGHFNEITLDTMSCRSDEERKELHKDIVANLKSTFLVIEKDGGKILRYPLGKICDKKSLVTTEESWC